MKKHLKLTLQFFRESKLLSMFLIILIIISLINFINSFGQMQYVFYTLNIYENSGLDNSIYFMPNYFTSNLGSLTPEERAKTIKDTQNKIKSINGVKSIVDELSITGFFSNDRSFRIYLSVLNEDFLNKNMKLNVKKGKWFSEIKGDEKSDGDIINTVIGGVDLIYKYKVDQIVTLDVMDMTNFQVVGQLKFKIIGILDSPGYTVKFNASSSYMTTNNLFGTSNVFIIEDSEKFMNIIKSYPSSTLRTSANFFINLDDDISDETKKSCLNKISDYGSYCDFETLVNNTKEENEVKFIQMLPLKLFMLIVSTVALISVSSLILFRKTNEYVIYYICGCNWRKCFSYISTAISGLCFIALIISFGYIYIIDFIRIKYPYFMTTVPYIAIFNEYTYLAVFVYLLITAFISVLIPYLIFKKNTPIEIYRRVKV